MSPRTLCGSPPRTPRRRRPSWAFQLAAVLLLSLISLPVASAAPVRADVGDITEYSLPTAGSFPGDITTGSDGNLWFTEVGIRKIARITPTGDLTEYQLPGDDNSPFGIAAGPDGKLWFTDISRRIGNITTAGDITEYDLPAGSGTPFALTTGPDGNLWFTEISGNRIGKITPKGQITEYPLPNADSGPDVITAGPDGNLWFTELFGNRIGKITPHGQITEYSLPTADSGPDGIAAGPDGNLWFTEQLTDGIGRITPDGDLARYPLPNPGSLPVRITAGPDANMWFTQIGGDRVGRLELDAGPPRADLAVRLTASATVRGGAEYTYAVTVTNEGPFAAEDLAVTLTLPRGVPAKAAPPGADRRSPTPLTWHVEALGAGQQRVFHATVRAGQRPTITAKAAVTSRTPDRNRRNNTDTATTRVFGR
ncbi:hypothetical protein PV721_33780 [Streptomyces sp. MB09-01]|uniref:virginiamycin B lyase family protein n=1 Tax=Streptomyces sp. MB09-01 TaxID=3028666 RepID=UPI0029A16153|nr:hypothetical protein [Streptomyces sp. MB09-01]MDX3539209.1 hypothetical protein [Streptomyces sp. MB09-01]